MIPFNSLLEKIWSLIIDPMIVISASQFKKIAGVYSMVRVKQKEDEDNNGGGGGGENQSLIAPGIRKGNQFLQRKSKLN